MSDCTVVRSAFAGAPSLKCDSTLTLEVSDILDLLETKGVNLALGHPDVWVAVGSCMYYGGALVLSRLGRADLMAVDAVCRHASLLEARPLHAGLHVTSYRRIHGTSAKSIAVHSVCVCVSVLSESQRVSTRVWLCVYVPIHLCLCAGVCGLVDSCVSV